MVRAGLHCTPNAHELIGTKAKGCVRIGIGYFSKKEDIDILANSLIEIIKIYKFRGEKYVFRRNKFEVYRTLHNRRV
jgi:hypothetical protein